MPVHSEGLLCDATVAVQVYWTMHKKSLLNGIQRALKVRELTEQDQAQGTCRMDNTEWESVPVEACFEYVTLLNLRTHQKLTSDKGERHVTEQIYVHTKLMIVDDLYAIFGSANINERSLSGAGDSEIAVLVVDQDTERADMARVVNGPCAPLHISCVRISGKNSSASPQAESTPPII